MHAKDKYIETRGNKNLLLSSILAFLTFGLFYIAFGIYFESSEPWVASIIYGNLTATPHGIWFTDNHFLQITPLGYIASLFQDIPVYGIWYSILTILYVWLWFFLSLRLIGRHVEGKVWLLMLVIPFVWAILGSSLVYAYFMRISILLASASLLLYLDYLTEGKRKNIFIVFFLLACSMRVSSGLMVLTIATLLAWMHLGKIRQVIRALWLPWILASICMGAILLYKAYSDNRGAKIDQILEYALLDRGAINPISIATTAKDSMRYRAVTEYFLISDSTQISLDFVKRLVDYDKLNLTGINSNDVDFFTEACLPWLITHKWILVLLYVNLLVLAYGQSWQLILRLLFLHIVAWAVIVAIGMKINMYHYFLEPWFAMLFGMSYFLLLAGKKPPLLRGQKALLGVLPIWACLNLWPILHAISLQEKDHNSQAEFHLRYLDKLTQNDIPVIWVNLMDHHFFPSDIFIRKETKVFRKSEYLCVYFWGYYPFAQERCINRLGFSPLDWRKMIEELQGRRSEVCFIMEERLAKFLPGYCRLLYGLQFEPKRDFSEPEVLPGVFIYRL